MLFSSNFRSRKNDNRHPPTSPTLTGPHFPQSGPDHAPPLHTTVPADGLQSPGVMRPPSYGSGGMQGALSGIGRRPKRRGGIGS